VDRKDPVDHKEPLDRKNPLDHKDVAPRSDAAGQSGGGLEELCSRLGGIEAELEDATRSLGPGRLEPAEAAALLDRFLGLARIVQRALVLVAADAAAHGAWSERGATSFSRYVAERGGSSMTGARAMLATSRRLAQLPSTTEALQEGRLALNEAVVLTAALEAHEPTRRAALEAELLCVAGDGPAALRERLRGLPALCSQATERAVRRRQHRQRYLRFWTDREGLRRIEGAGPPEDLAPLEAVVRREAAAREHAASHAGHIEDPAACRFDALVGLAARGARCGDPHPAEPHRGAVDAHVVVHIDLEALERGWAAPSERCEIPGVGRVPVAAVRELMSTAVVDLVVRRGIDVRTVVTMGRYVPRALRVALMARDPVCVVPGCGEAHDLVIDQYRTRWSLVGPVGIDNLCRICARHHRMRHLEGYVLEGGPGSWRFYRRE
jgi:hypothetical protein